MINFATIGLVAALAIFALVALGYFFGAPLLRRVPPRVRRLAEIVGHGLLFFGWTALQYPVIKDHLGLRDWRLYFSLTVVAVWAVVTVKRIARTLTSPDESFGSGTHA